MKKLKILFIIDYLSAGGGTENQVKALISNLDRERYEPFLVTLSRLKGWSELPQYDNPGCPHICLELRRIICPKTVFDLIKLSRMIRRKKIDIVQTFFVDANIIGVISGFLGGCKNIIVSRRDMGFWYTPKILFFLKQVNRQADYFMVNSEAIKKTVIEYEKVEPERIKVIHNGVFELPDDRPSKLVKSDLGIPEDSPLVGIVANLRTIKRIDNFIRIAAAVKAENARFMVVGTGSLKEELIKQANEAGIGDRIQFTHTLDGIYDYVKLFDVGVLTSDSEGLSNTLIEYQLCGIPAVAFDVGGNKEVIDHGKTGFLVEHGGLDEMRSKIDLLLSDRDLGERMGRKGVKRARVKFDGERMIKETVEFYQTITSC